MTLETIVPVLPHVSASLNALSALFLGAGFYQIRRGERDLHRRCMSLALIVSAIFMVSYLTYHSQVGYTPFEGQGAIRPVYFTLLASHVILAAIIVPMVIFTLFHALRGNFRMHPRIARWTLPLWFYVSISGVVIYLMGFHIYHPD